MTVDRRRSGARNRSEFAGAGCGDQLIAGQREFGDQRCQAFEGVERDAHRIGAPFGRRRSRTEDALQDVSSRRGQRLRRLTPSFAGAFDLGDQPIVVARRFPATFRNRPQDELYSIDRGQHQGDGASVRRRAVAEPNDQRSRNRQLAEEPLQNSETRRRFLSHGPIGKYSPQFARPTAPVRNAPIESR